ncbi:Guanylate cyclase [Operophtera brumata]|uniref:Guanylate cyclase n=1 Tax=Operophtera brumata TaxID=104452 RepID=A0A0L7LV01_OPEBR|nr:Guanylate cyclase [Operophtera brumata]
MPKYITITTQLLNTIVILSVRGSLVREFLLAAHALGMTRGDWARDAAARVAYEALLRVSLKLPTGDRFDEFADTVRARARHHYNYTFSDGEEPVSGKAIHWPGGRRGPPPDTPRCGFLGTDPMCQGAFYHGLNMSYKPVSGKAIHWPGGRRGPTPGTPRCGFLGTDPMCQGGGSVLPWPQHELQAGQRQGYPLARGPPRAAPGHTALRLSRNRPHARNVSHENTARFIGACVDCPLVFVLTEYCPKGSLKDISDYGLNTLCTPTDLIKDDTYYYSSIYPGSVSSLKGDVYSFGIILEEIVLRAGPFHHYTPALTYKEIVSRVCARESPPFRPVVGMTEVAAGGGGGAAVELLDLAAKCWIESADDRPSGYCDNLMDDLLRRMEQYANNLESLVEEKTEQLSLEKRRSEELLYQVLPRYCKNNTQLIVMLFLLICIIFKSYIYNYTLAAR